MGNVENPDTNAAIVRARLNDPRLEQAYLDGSFPEFVRLLRFGLGLGIMIYGGFIVADRIVLEKLPPDMLWNRVVVCGLAGMTFLWSFFRSFKPYVRWSLFALHLFTGFGTIHLAANDERYLAAIYSVVIFFPLLTRGQFIRGVFANVILATAFAYLQTQQPAFQKAVMDSLLLFSAVTVVALATFAKETAERHAFIEKHRAELEAVRSYSLLLNAISPASAEELLSAGERSASDNVQACVVFLEFTLPAADHADVPHGVPDLNLMTSESAMRHGLAITRTSPFSYMLVALSGANEKESVMRSAEFCLALSKTFNDRMIHAGPSTFRAGICAGSIRTAMVEGRHAYYDFEDKTMTMASGLMMRALPRRVLVCRETYQILKSDFELEESHNVYVEHVGHVPAYVLLAKRS